MKKSLTLENMFENEKVRSILRLLSEFKDEGLQPRYIRFALQNEYATEKQIEEEDTELSCNIDGMKEFFGTKLISLYDNNYIKQGCLKTREQLNYYLKQLGKDNLDVIEKKGKSKRVKYFIKQDAYNEIRRLQNKECLYFFPREKIKFFPIKYPSGSVIGGHMIYGLSDEIYNKLFNSNDRETVKDGLEKIERVLKDIYNIKIKRLHEKRDRRLKMFLESTKSNSIKEFLQKDGDILYSKFYNGIALSEWDGVDILHSETIFLYCFKYGIRFSGHIDEKTIEGIPHVADMKRWMDEMDEKQFCIMWSMSFLDKGYDLSKYDIKTITEEQFEKVITEKEQLKESIIEEFLEKGESFDNHYFFSKKEIEEIIQWGWDNRDLFEMCIPIEIAYSRYNVYNEYPLTSALEK